MKPKLLFLHRLMIIGISILSGIVIMILTGENPSETLEAFFLIPFSNHYFLGNMLASSVPLILTGLAASVAFRANEFNLGIEGQVYCSSLVGTIIALYLPPMPKFLALLIIISTAA